MALGKYAARVAALCIAATFAFVPVAGAYKLPKPPGSPGGPPKPSTGGTHTTKEVTTHVGNDLAGFTDGELAKLGKVTVNFTFPETGAVSCVVSEGKTTIGTGHEKGNKGNKRKLAIKFTSAGIALLKKNNGHASTLTISCTFITKGHTAISITTLKTDP